MSLNASETFRAKLSAGAWVGGRLFWRLAPQVWVVRDTTFVAAVLDSVEAIFPVMTLVKATIAHLVFVDDLPLVLGVGVFQPETVGG